MRTILALLLLIAGLAPGDAEAQQTIFSDEQVANADFTDGPLSRVNGSRGKGRFFYTFRAATNTFGPLRVISHDRQAIVVRGRTTSCAFHRDRSIECENGSVGSWQFAGN